MRLLTEEDGNSKGYRPPGNPTGKKCVSISIFGTPQKVASYQAPSLRLANSISQLLPGWELHVYYEEENPPSAEYFSQLKAVRGVPVELFPRERSTGRAGCFWRYESHDTCDVVFYRDAELPISEVEAPLITDHFLNALQPVGYFQVAHARNTCLQAEVETHGRCRRKVLGGLYMMKRTELNMTKLARDYPNKAMYGADEHFLTEVIHPKFESVVYYAPIDKIRKTVKMEEFRDLETYVEMERPPPFRRL